MNLIVARGINGEIGANNSLLWNLPGDMKHFKETTQYNTIIMGRKTWESMGQRILPHRQHIILTRNVNHQIRSPFVRFMTLDELVAKINSYDSSFYGDLFVIGGAEIYNLLDHYINVMYITEVEQTYPEADTFFLGLSGAWDTEPIKTAVENGIKYSIYKHTRRK